MYTHPFGITVCDRTVRVHGDIDMAVADQLLETITGTAENLRPDTLVLDMAGVTFLDSTGISALIMAHQRVGALGQVLVVHDVPDNIAKVMKVAGVIDYLDVQSVLP